MTGLQTINAWFGRHATLRGTLGRHYNTSGHHTDHHTRRHHDTPKPVRVVPPRAARRYRDMHAKRKQKRKHQDRSSRACQMSRRSRFARVGLTKDNVTAVSNQWTRHVMSNAAANHRQTKVVVFVCFCDTRIATHKICESYTHTHNPDITYY